MDRDKAATLDEVTVATGGYGGVAALVAAAEQRVSVARGDNLDTGAVPSLIARSPPTRWKPAPPTAALATQQR